MASLKVPNLVWISLLVAVSAFVALNWPDAPWANLVTLIVAAILKGLEVQTPPASMTERMAAPPSRWRQFLVG